MKQRDKFRSILVLLSLAALPLVTSCDLLKILQPPEIEVQLNEVFQLALGQTARLPSENLSIAFQAVVEDSRCPVNVQCVWAGNASVTLEVVQAGQSNKTLTLNSTIEPHAANYGNFRIRFEDLKPQPQADRTIQPGEYRLSLSVTRIASQ